MASTTDSSTQAEGLLIKVDNSLTVARYPELRCVLTDSRAIVPKRATAYACGLDLAPFIDGVVNAKSVVIVSVGVAVEIPHGYYGRIATRSNILIRGISISGDIDNDYRGDLKLIVTNHTDFQFILQAGVPVAHLILTPYSPANVLLVSHLDGTERGANAFGSSTSAANQYILDKKEPMIYTKVLKDALPMKIELPKK